ncbi:hypothetical protein EDF81_4344 [Enterobacter sp. BIGb0383]|uniref:hypothetical protein n=1 Tax=unclassified Enterobacter TaxID=2608935 RepID=UPI000F4A3ED2|nr:MULTISPECIES: hypothetical protein [unclassified Enterobacter]ROP49336.1 hypothetical protein EDF81_4344 [Enterobacter sp. BIGb0383]ROS00788.1 hypothetical protein EC848_4484 [Enterobacter sp. BIGb0359]
MSKITISTLQKNTQQVIPGYWKITLAESAKTVTSIVELTAGAYCVTHDMTEHKTFIAALTHVLPLYQAAQSVFNISVMAQSARRAMMLALLGVASVGTAQASNIDVNAFLVKAQTAIDHTDRHDLYNEAVNAFDNLNARDRMVVAGIADKTNHEGMIRDVIGSAEARGHQAVVPQGWNVEKTQEFLRAAHPVAATPAPTARMAPAPAVTFDPVAHANANASAALHMIQTTDSTVAQNQKDIAAAQHTADSAMSNAAQVNGKVDVVQKEVMTVDQRVDGVEHTANHANANANAALHMLQNTDNAVVQNQKDIAVVQNDVTTVDQRVDGVEHSANHANTNATAALHMLQKTDSAVVGMQLEQANRDRTASQRVATPAEPDTTTQAQVSDNTTSLRAVIDEQQTQGDHVQTMDQVVSHNSATIAQNAQRIDTDGQRIDRNAKRIDETREDLKRGLNNAAAMTGLHYHSNDAYALSVGTANGEGAALAGGLSHGFTQHTAATVQASTSMDGGYMASVGFSGDF